MVETEEHSGFRRAFRSEAERELPARPYDWGYPICWWRKSGGVNRDALLFWFPYDEFRSF
jgi:hypothetical protein